MWVGFIGTLQYMTEAQYDAVGNLMLYREITEAHHMMRRGADTQFNDMCDQLCIKRYVHQPALPAYGLGGGECEYLSTGQTVAACVNTIVRTCSLLIVATCGYDLPVGYATTQAIRRASELGKGVKLFGPNGKLFEFYPRENILEKVSSRY